MALSPNSQGLLVQILLDGTSQLMYTVPTGQVALLKELLFNAVADSTFEYCIGGNAAGNLHLPSTFKEAGMQFREIINYPLAPGTTIYAWRNSAGVVSLELLGETWYV